MRSIQQIRDARTFCVRQILDPALDNEQRLLIRGMSVALQWVCDEGGYSALEQLLSGQPVAKREAIKDRLPYPTRAKVDAECDRVLACKPAKAAYAVSTTDSEE